MNATMESINFVTVTIAKFEKYRARKDVENPTWYKCSNSLLEDPDFYHFSHEEICVWLRMLELASKKQSATVRLNLAHCERACRLSRSAVFSAISKLKELGALCDADVTPTLRARDVDVPLDKIRLDKKREEKNPSDSFTAPETPAAVKPKKPKQTFAIESVDQLRETVGADRLAELVTLYSAEYVERELAKMLMWLTDNPRKNRKSKTGWRTFASGWLDRGWAKFQAAIPVSAPSGKVGPTSLSKVLTIVPGVSAVDLAAAARTYGPGQGDYVSEMFPHRVWELIEAAGGWSEISGRAIDEITDRISRVMNTPTAAHAGGPLKAPQFAIGGVA